MNRIVKKLLCKRANTLVEVIISMLIISIAAAMLSAGIMTAINMYQRGNEILDNLASAELSMENRIADLDSDEDQVIQIHYEKGDDEDDLFVTMDAIKQPLGINADLYYYLYR